MAERRQRDTLFASVSSKLSAIFGQASKTRVPEEQVDARIHFVPYEEPLAETPKQEELQNKLKNYVAQHIGDTHLTAQEMATALNVSRATLFNMSHEAFGMTPISYLLEKRKNYAIQLLKMGVKPYHVAQRCGYADPKYFGKVFKKQFGILPSQAKELIIIEKQQTQDA